MIKINIQFINFHLFNNNNDLVIVESYLMIDFLYYKAK
jgi:hypothetical protein